MVEAVSVADATARVRRCAGSCQVCDADGALRRDVTGAGLSFVLPAQPRDRRPRGGTAHPFTATAQPREHAVLDLGRPRVVRMLEFPLRQYYPKFGRRFAIEISNDGVNWSVAWDGLTGGTALAGALEDQVLVPMRFMLPDIDTRYLRIHPPLTG